MAASVFATRSGVGLTPPSLTRVGCLQGDTSSPDKFERSVLTAGNLGLASHALCEQFSLTGPELTPCRVDWGKYLLSNPPSDPSRRSDPPSWPMVGVGGRCATPIPSGPCRVESVRPGDSAGGTRDASLPSIDLDWQSGPVGRDKASGGNPGTGGGQGGRPAGPRGPLPRRSVGSEFKVVVEDFTEKFDLSQTWVEGLCLQFLWAAEKVGSMRRY